VARLRVFFFTAGGIVILAWTAIRWDDELATKRRHKVFDQVQAIATSLRGSGPPSSSALQGLGSIERFEIINAIDAPGLARSQEFRIVFRRDARGPIGLSTEHVWCYLSFQASGASFIITNARVDETFN